MPGLEPGAETGVTEGERWEREREEMLLCCVAEKWLRSGLVHGSETRGRRAVMKGGGLNRRRSCAAMWVSPHTVL